MEIEFKWERPVKQISEDVSGGKNGLLFLANEAKRLMDPYVPAMNLILAQNVKTYVEQDKGIVHYMSPYAHYQYEGILYGPNIPMKDGDAIKGYFSPPRKTPTGRRLNYSKSRHPLATSEWDKAMMRSRKDDLARAYQSYLRGGSR